MIEYILIYLIACLILSFLRPSSDKLGFWGWFFFGMFFTPAVSLTVFILTRKLENDHVKGK